MSAVDIDEVELLVSELDKDSKDVLLGALEMFNNEEVAKGHETLSSLLKAGNKEALFISSMFSKESEGNLEFEKRHIDFLKKSAEKGMSLAIYTLGVYHDTHNKMVEYNPNLANDLFRKAAELKHAHSMYIHGSYLYYKSENSKDLIKGLSLINKSADLHDKDALLLIKKILIKRLIDLGDKEVLTLVP